MRFFSAVLFLWLSIFLTGCVLVPTAAPSASEGSSLQGVVRGGQQPIIGARVYLFETNVTGFGGPGIAPSPSNASISLLSGTGLSDTVGSYVATDNTGRFSITGDYFCIANEQVYIYAVDGDPGAGPNSGVGLLAALGSCPVSGNFLQELPLIQVNEVTTIAAAYALAGFAADATHISTSGTPLAQIGIANAFSNAANLANVATGQALSVTPAGNGAAPQATINTLANIIAACVNSSGSNSSPCATLFGDARSNGTTGTTPTDTATAAINIAHNPIANVQSLYALSSATPPFAPMLGAQPHDFTVSISFTGGNISRSLGIAIDGFGNAWIANSDYWVITKLSSTGAILSGANGYPITFGNIPGRIAIDQSGNAWVAGRSEAATKLSSSGTILSGTSGYPAYGGDAVAIDGSGNAWISGASTPVTKLASDGTPYPGSPYNPNPGAFAGTGSTNIAVDSTGNAWVTIGPRSVSKLSNSGSLLNMFTDNTDLSFNTPLGIAIDHSNNVWVGAGGVDTAELSSSGAVLSGTTGFNAYNASAYDVAIDGAGNAWVQGYIDVYAVSPSGSIFTGSHGYQPPGLSNAMAIAIDGSGDIWLPDYDNSAVFEIIGAATPVVTPLSVGVTNNALGTRP